MTREYPDIYPALLEGPRVLLRELEPTDLDAAMRWGTDPEFFRYSPHDVATSRIEELAFLEAAKADALARPRWQYHLGIVWRDGNELVGSARLGISDPDAESGDVGYGLRRDRWGEGIATETTALLVEFGFDVLGLHRIFAYHHPDNVASGRVLAKVGMHYEGRLRDNMRSHGSWRDSMVWAILASDPRSPAVSATTQSSGGAPLPFSGV